MVESERAELIGYVKAVATGLLASEGANLLGVEVDNAIVRKKNVEFASHVWAKALALHREGARRLDEKD